MAVETLRKISRCFLVGLAAVLAGCGSQLTVEGIVKYDGKEVEDGFISFVPKDGQGATAGSPIKNGKYKVTGLTPGTWQVQVCATKQVEFLKHSPDPAKVTPGLQPAADLIPADAVGNYQDVEISGSRQLDLDLKKPVSQ